MYMGCRLEVVLAETAVCINVDTCICPPTGAMHSELNGSINVNGNASFVSNYAQEIGGGNLRGSSISLFQCRDCCHIWYFDTCN